MPTSMRGEAAHDENMWKLRYAGVAVGAGSYMLVPETTVMYKAVRVAGFVGGAYLLWSSLKGLEEKLIDRTKLTSDTSHVIGALKLPNGDTPSPAELKVDLDDLSGPAYSSILALAPRRGAVRPATFRQFLLYYNLTPAWLDDYTRAGNPGKSTATTIRSDFAVMNVALKLRTNGKSTAADVRREMATNGLASATTAIIASTTTVQLIGAAAAMTDIAVPTAASPILAYVGSGFGVVTSVNPVVATVIGSFAVARLAMWAADTEVGQKLTRNIESLYRTVSGSPLTAEDTDLMFARSDAANGRTGLDVYDAKALPSGSSDAGGDWLGKYAVAEKNQIAEESQAVRDAIAAHPVEPKGVRTEWERDRKKLAAEKKKKNDAYFPRA